MSRTIFLAWIQREICTVKRDPHVTPSADAVLVRSFRDAEDYGRYTRRDSATFVRTERHLGRAQPHQHVLYHHTCQFHYQLFIFRDTRTYIAHVQHASEYQGRLANIQTKWENYIGPLLRISDFMLIVSENAFWPELR